MSQGLKARPISKISKDSENVPRNSSYAVYFIPKKKKIKGEDVRNVT